LTRQGDLLGLLKEEVNVEEVRVISGALEEGHAYRAELDTVITPALRQKGYRREFLRYVMNARKEADLKPVDRVVLQLVLPAGELRTVLEMDVVALARDARAAEVLFVEALSETSLTTQEVTIDEQAFSFALIRV
jgi:hypothetical protein